VKHLGNKLKCNNSMNQDIAMKKGKFIGKVNSVAQEFLYATPGVFLTILNIYCTSLFKSWNVSMSLACKVPWTTHMYLIKCISNCVHLKVMLASRLVKFLGSLKRSSKLGIRLLAGISEMDRMTVLGRCISNIAEEVGTSAAGLTPSIVKSKMKCFQVPEDQE
jgi:hypothetical protein